MKETLKTVLLTTLILLVVLLSIKSMKCYQKSQEKPETKTITVTDTLTQVMYDTVFIDHFETVKLPVVDTVTIINDSIRIDSVFVVLPISKYSVDTTFVTDSTVFNLSIINSGYAVKLDSLSYYFEYTPTPQVIKKRKNRFGFFIGPSVGISYDWTTGKTLPTVGIGVGIGWSIKKY